MLNIPSVGFQEVPQIRELFTYEERLNKTAIKGSSLRQKIGYIYRLANNDDALTQLERCRQETYNEYTKFVQKVNDLKNFLIEKKILSEKTWESWSGGINNEKTPIVGGSESRRHFCIKKEIDDFYDNVEKEPIQTLPKRQSYDFDIPKPLIEIIGKTKYQWICNVHYFYENAPQKGKKVPTTIIISSSIPPKSPSPPSNQQYLSLFGF